MRIVLLQHNPKAGDCAANARQLASLARKARNPVMKEDVLCLTPSCALTGHPWQQLARVDGFYKRCGDAAEALAAMLDAGIDMLLSLPAAEGCRYMFLSHGTARPVVRDQQGIMELPGLCLYLPELAPEKIFPEGIPHSKSSHNLGGAKAVLFMTAHPWLPDEQVTREKYCSSLARLWHSPVLLTNQYGGTDGDIYAGQSCAFLPDGSLAARAASFVEDSITLDLPDQSALSPARTTCPHGPSGVKAMPDREEALFRAMSIGVGDYAHKCGMTGVVLGLSGGMDSALAACVAAEAVGPEQVLGILMPSPWSSNHSVEDARILAGRLGIRTVTAPIGDIMKTCETVLSPLFACEPAQPDDLTAENLQPRIRGALIMAFANRHNLLALATSNKSEAAVGYCTLYGDTVGGLEPLGDIYKTEVYAVARRYNALRGQEIIPERIFVKAPSAELKPGQTDQDSLPPYDVLDSILRELLEGGANPETLCLPGVAPAIIRDVARRVAHAEFKRHQLPPVIRLSPCALGVDWNMPVAARILPVY